MCHWWLSTQTFLQTFVGKNWFKNMRKEFKDEFPVYSDNDDVPVFKENLNLKEWSEKKRTHIIQFNDSQLLDLRERVFVVETEQYQFDSTDKTKNVRLVVNHF